jgi:hypothetical protein
MPKAEARHFLGGIHIVDTELEALVVMPRPLGWSCLRETTKTSTLVPIPYS